MSTTIAPEKKDGAQWLVQATVEQWSDEQWEHAQAFYGPEWVPGYNMPFAEEMALACGVADQIVVTPRNALLTAGITRMLNLLTAAGGQGLNSTHCRIGTGNGSTGVVVGDTDLSAAAGSANRWFQLCDSVSVSTNVLTVVATFATGDGNFIWAEWGIDFGTASSNAVTAPLLNRKVAALGTKGSGAPWTLTVTVTIT